MFEDEGQQGDDLSSNGKNDVVAAYKERHSSKNWKKKSSSITIDKPLPRSVSSSSSSHSEGDGVCPTDHAPDTSDAISRDIHTFYKGSNSPRRNATTQEYISCPRSDDDDARDTATDYGGANSDWNFYNQLSKVADLNAATEYSRRFPSQAGVLPNPTRLSQSSGRDDPIPEGGGGLATTRRPLTPSSELINAQRCESSIHGSPVLSPFTFGNELLVRGRDAQSVASEPGSILEWAGSKRSSISPYVRLLLPSAELAARASHVDESVRAVTGLCRGFTLRQTFRLRTIYHDSPAVLPPIVDPTDPWGSREPRFDPYSVPLLPNIKGRVVMVKGVANVFTDLSPEGDDLDPQLPLIHEKLNLEIPTVTQYIAALKEMMSLVQDPACKSLAYQRLKYLEERFSFHLLFNGQQEQQEVRMNNHRDFYNIRKVDTHVHHSACMTQKHLLRYIRRKYRSDATRIVAADRDGKALTLREIFKNLGMSAWEASVDQLNVHALNSCFHRFDLFNAKYNPFGAPLLREVFLKIENKIEGEFLAEITQECIADLEAAKYQFVEWRVSCYGHSPQGWYTIAKWLEKNKLYSKNVRWVIQVPRLYHVYKALGKIESMECFLRNIFEPPIQAVLKPADHPEIFKMLQHTIAWDCVDDESTVSKFTMDGGDLDTPEKWTSPHNPPYAYFMYYMYANIRVLNILLQARGMNTMPFRPHCGESGSISHLASAGLLSDGINHGLTLRKSPVMQYLFYLWQIGIAMSPLSNNALFYEISKSPFISYHRIGLNVSLSSDDPLMFHFTDEALLEEYSVCAHIWKLSPVDLCELARNSVLQSNFEPQFKRHWLGPKYYKKGPRGNDIRSTNVPNVRLAYREETLREELKFLRDVIISHQIDPGIITALKTSIGKDGISRIDE